MAENFQELRAGMSVEAKTASVAERRRLLEEMSLYQLRKARELTQTQIAGELHMGQGMCPNWKSARTCTSARSPVISRRSARS